MFEPYFRKRVIKPFGKTLRKLANALGDVRDLDVFRTKTDKHIEALSDGERQELQALRDDCEGQCAAARDRLIDLLDSNRYARFVADFAEFVATPEQGARATEDEAQTRSLLRHLAPGLIYERYGDVRAYEVGLKEAPLDTLHRLRIDAKRLRYMLEALEEVLGPDAKAVIGSLKALQDHLGDLQDSRVAIMMMEDFVDSADDNQSTAGVLRYMAVRESEKQQLLAGVPPIWQTFTTPEGRRSLALAVSVL
jgi:triphosphatase